MTRRASGREAAAVFVGAVAGALARLVIDGGIESDVLWDIAAINVAGSALMGVIMALVNRSSHPVAFAFLGTGFLGAFTTFSALAVFNAGAPVEVRCGVLILTLAGSVGAHRLARRACERGARTA